MKKAFILIALIVAPALVFAQGTVLFANNSSGLVRQWTSQTDPTLVSTPVGGAQVQLFAAPVGTALNPLFAPSGSFPNYSSLASFLAANPGWNAYAITGIRPVAGRFNGGTVTVSPLSPGGNIEYFIIGWTGSYATFDAAVAAGTVMGSSALSTSSTGDPTTTPPGTAVSLSATFTGVTLGPSCLGPYFWFTSQPTSQTVLVGGAATFSVGAVACPAPNYQWYFNSVSIPWANGSSFQIANAQLTNAGNYWVVLSSPVWGDHTSATATLTVLERPTILFPPRSQTACEGDTVYFQTSATGTGPLTYLWRFNANSVLSSGTNSFLRLTNVEPARAGAYTVVVTNVAGAVTSLPAMLSVIPPVDQRTVPGVVLRGQPGSILSLEDVDSLGPSPAWVTLDSVMLTNTSQWVFDTSMPLPTQRYYRARQASGLSVVPTLDPKMVPALTLTGLVGRSVRVDNINQFGPTDAWVTLGTVTLSSTSQLYFDISAPGQPPRLYRLVQLP